MLVTAFRRIPLPSDLEQPLKQRPQLLDIVQRGEVFAARSLSVLFGFDRPAMITLNGLPDRRCCDHGASRHSRAERDCPVLNGMLLLGWS
jgi:hypothetical protein